MPARFSPAAILALAVAVSPTVGQEASGDTMPAAPFGLTWGASAKATEQLGVNLQLTNDAATGIRAEARNLPKALRDTEAVVLFFGFDDGLWRVYTRSAPFPSDRSGTAAVTRFEELAAILDERYGKGRRIKSSPPANSLFAEPERFALSLGNNDRIYAGVWDTGELGIEMLLGATGEDTYYSIAYEYKPLATAARQAIRDREKGAL